MSNQTKDRATPTARPIEFRGIKYATREARDEEGEPITIAEDALNEALYNNKTGNYKGNQREARLLDETIYGFAPVGILANCDDEELQTWVNNNLL